jgi:hypothetical protein
MFDQGELPDEAAWLERLAAGLDLIDESDVIVEPEPRVSDAEFAEWAAELEGLTAPSPLQAVTAGVSQPITPAIVAQLAALDPASLDDETRVDFCVAWSRVRNYADAKLGRAVAAQIAATSAVGGPKDVVRIEAERLAAAELAAALCLGTGAADSLVFVADSLARRLSATAAAVEAGDVTWGKAATLAHATALLDTVKARAVEAKVLPAAARRTPAQHSDACRRWVDRIDPQGADERRRKKQSDIRLVATHHGSGMGELFAAMPSEQLDLIWMAADLSARRQNEAGDPRSLDELRVAALVEWAEEFLHEQEPHRHGRLARQRIVWDVTSLLGVTSHCAELLDSGATLPPEAVRDLLDRGARMRRMLISPDTGELDDLTRNSWPLAPTAGVGELPLVDLHVTVETWLHVALTVGDLTDLTSEQRHVVRGVCTALAGAPASLRSVIDALLSAPVTADVLDGAPDAYEPSTALAEFVGLRDRHPTNPTAGPTSAAAADIDHVVPFGDGGRTVRDNLASISRRWHLLKTHAGWTVTHTETGWTWTSPTGRSYATQPYDYRLGP